MVRSLVSLCYHLQLTVFPHADEIIMHEGVTAVYKSNVDLFFCVLGAQNENEVRKLQIWVYCDNFYPFLLQLMLVGVLNALYDSINSLLKYVTIDLF